MTRANGAVTLFRSFEATIWLRQSRLHYHCTSTTYRLNHILTEGQSGPGALALRDIAIYSVPLSMIAELPGCPDNRE